MTQPADPTATTTDTATTDVAVAVGEVVTVTSPLQAFAEFVVSLDDDDPDSPGRQARKTITLTRLVHLAVQALTDQQATQAADAQVDQPTSPRPIAGQALAQAILDVDILHNGLTYGVSPDRRPAFIGEVVDQALAALQATPGPSVPSPA